MRERLRRPGTRFRLASKLSKSCISISRIPYLTLLQHSPPSIFYLHLHLQFPFLLLFLFLLHLFSVIHSNRVHEGTLPLTAIYTVSPASTLAFLRSDQPLWDFHPDVQSHKVTITDHISYKLILTTYITLTFLSLGTLPCFTSPTLPWLQIPYLISPR